MRNELERYEDDKTDHEEYFYFTGKSRLDRAMHTLEGLLEGITADGKVNDAEVSRLAIWLGQHSEFSDRHPFNEVIPILHQIVTDTWLNEDDRAGLLWVCNKYTTEENYYDAITSDMQRLQGVLAGILADGVISEDEISSLAGWLDANEHLQSCWPYDELQSLITSVMRDGRIDESEQKQLQAFFGEFTNTPGRKAVGPIDREATITGICAVCPEILFDERFFCFTGASKRSNRDGLAQIIRQHGGEFHPNLRKDTNYLIVGADGNPCWAFACYGRKVEDAMRRRREGQRLLIVHENDFWDAVADG